MEKLTPFKEMSKQDKISYIWDYWKWPIIFFIIALMIIPSTIKSIVTHKDPNLAILMINSHSKDSGLFEEILSSYGEDSLVQSNANLGFNEEGSPIGFYLDDTVLSAQLNSGSFDIFFGNGEKFDFIAEEGYLIDLSTVISESTMKKIPQDHILYSTVGDRIESYPCAILFDDCEALKDYYPDKSFYCGIIYDNPNPENAARVMEELLLEQF